MKITVLLGGAADERDVSLASGAQIAAALRKAGHQVAAWDTVSGLLSADREGQLRDGGVGRAPMAQGIRDRLAGGEVRELLTHPVAGNADVYFLALHGGAGEDGRIQALLEAEGVTFTGSDRIGCLLGMDKDLTKRLLRDAGLPTPPWVTDPGSVEEVEQQVGIPTVVKAAGGGSSLRLLLAHDRVELEAALRAGKDFDDHVVAERYIKGREFTVGILGDRALPVGEIIPENELFDYECKYQPGMAQEIFPADLPASVSDEMKTLALAIHRTLRLRDYSRVDFMLDEDGGIWCLEANTLPGMTANSLFPRAARAAGLEFPELCHQIASLAVERSQG